MRGIIFVLLSCMAASASGNSIDVAGQELRIPTPQGLAPIGPEVGPVHEFLELHVTGENQSLLWFVDEHDLPKILKGEVPDLRRRGSVQTPIRREDRVISPAGFAEMRALLKNEITELFKEFEREMTDVVDRVNQGVPGIDVFPATFGGTVLLPPHAESNDILSYSLMSRYDVDIGSDAPEPVVTVVTTTFIHVRDRLLFLYVAGQEDDLEWTRDVSTSWANAVLEANQGQTQAQTAITGSSRQHSESGIDWRRVAAKAVGVGLIVAVALAVGRRRRRE